MRAAWPLVLVAFAACTGDDGGTPVDPNDVDGDGIPNESDLCPNRQDPAQHDDDADGVGDACDNCAAASNADQADTTEMRATLPQFPDGVGDACDRRPTQADDKLARFFPFADPAEANSFTGTGWTIANDHATAATARWQVKRTEQGDGLSLQARITRLAWTPDDGTLSLVTDGDGISSGFVCSIVHTQTGDSLTLAELGGLSASMPLPELHASDLLVLTASRAFTQNLTGKAACFLSINGAAEKRIDIDTTDDSPFGSYALVADKIDVELSAATVWTTPFACDTPFTGGAPLACP